MRICTTTSSTVQTGTIPSKSWLRSLSPYVGLTKFGFPFNVCRPFFSLWVSVYCTYFPCLIFFRIRCLLIMAITFFSLCRTMAIGHFIVALLKNILTPLSLRNCTYVLYPNFNGCILNWVRLEIPKMFSYPTTDRQTPIVLVLKTKNLYPTLVHQNQFFKSGEPKICFYPTAIIQNPIVFGETISHTLLPKRQPQLWSLTFLSVVGIHFL